LEGLGGISEESSIITKFAGKIEDLKTVKGEVKVMQLILLYLVLLN
jgi:hypothetical protein